MDNLDYDTSYNRISTNTLIRNTWQTFVYVYKDGRAYLYVDGVSVDANGHLHNASGIQVFSLYQPTWQHAIVAQATRAWTQEDVDIFHNEGNFLTYEDLQP